MKYYPILLDVENRHCLVAGAGTVGVRKAKTLIGCGARVTMVSPDFSGHQEGLKALGIVCLQKKYEAADITGMSLVFAATGDAGINQQIGRDAEAQNIFCNVADAPDRSDFIVPSVVQRGDLVLAVSTTGKSPAMARQIRKELEQIFGPEYGVMLNVMGNIRKHLLEKSHAPEDHKKIFYTLIESGLLEMIKADDEKKMDALLKDLIGKQYTYKDFI